MQEISENMSLIDVASIVSNALTAAGIEAVLIGGAAVSIYSDNLYESYDLDFATSYGNKAIASALLPLGFKLKQTGRYFAHPNTEFLIEFPATALQFGETEIPFEQSTSVQTELGTIRVITPTQSVMDRLAAYIHWKDRQSHDQALAVIKNNPIEWNQLYDWANSEGISSDLIDQLRDEQQ